MAGNNNNLLSVVSLCLVCHQQYWESSVVSVFPVTRFEDLGMPGPSMILIFPGSISSSILPFRKFIEGTSSSELGEIAPYF